MTGLSDQIGKYVTIEYGAGSIPARRGSVQLLVTQDPDCSTPPPACPSPFTDVPADSQFCADITWLAENKITTGYTDGSYHPTASITRRAMAAFLYRYANPSTTPAACTSSPFHDVGPSTQFCAEIQWLKDHQIVTGFRDGSFHPDAAVSRQAMAAYMYRISNSRPAPACTNSPFDDVAADNQFCGDISWLVDKGVTTGYADGGFHPLEPVTRQAMAAFLHRLYGATH